MEELWSESVDNIHIDKLGDCMAIWETMLYSSCGTGYHGSTSSQILGHNWLMVGREFLSQWDQIFSNITESKKRKPKSISYNSQFSPKKIEIAHEKW